MIVVPTLSQTEESVRVASAHARNTDISVSRAYITHEVNKSINNLGLPHVKAKEEEE